MTGGKDPVNLTFHMISEPAGLLDRRFPYGRGEAGSPLNLCSRDFDGRLAEWSGSFDRIARGWPRSACCWFSRLSPFLRWSSSISGRTAPDRRDRCLNFRLPARSRKFRRRSPPRQQNRLLHGHISSAFRCSPGTQVASVTLVTNSSAWCGPNTQWPR